jgi:FemAB-related protein (PEP-CTERM system-associated)
MIANALSVDVEEYYHAGIFRRGTAGFTARQFESRVQQSLDDLLELFRDNAVKATFFVLGEIAAHHPGSVRKIAAEGHEIGCHSDCHEDVYRQTPEEFRQDLRQAKQRIEDAIGAPVIGYRAPNFSIGRAQCWAYQILLEEGFRYDSSTYPIVHDRYGHHRAPRFPFEIWRDGSERLVEFPIGTVRLLGWNMPIGGGGYFRLAPFSITRMGISRVNAVEHRPVMFYLHPWEIDPGQPRPVMALRHAFRHYVGVRRQAEKLGRLFKRFHFASARDVLREWIPSDEKTISLLRPQLVDRTPRVARLPRTSGTLVHVTRLAPDAMSAWPRLSASLATPHLAHAVEWAAVIRDGYGHTPLYLAAEDESGQRGLLPAVIVRRPLLGTVVASMPFLDGGGPCAASPELESALLARLVQEARRLGARLVEVRSSRQLPIDTAPREHKVNLVLPLAPGLDAVFAGIDRAARSQIRKAERSGLSIEVGGAELLDAFCAIYATRMHELGSPMHARRFFAAIFAHFGDRARLMLARTGTTPVGALVALATEHTVTVPWASSLRDYAALCPNMLLYWEAIRAASRDGFARFDFGRSTKHSGTYRFKRQWGAVEEPIYWYSVPVTAHRDEPIESPSSENTGAGELGVQLWRYLPLGVTRQLGPHVRKYLTQ